MPVYLQFISDQSCPWLCQSWWHSPWWYIDSHHTLAHCYWLSSNPVTYHSMALHYWSVPGNCSLQCTNGESKLDSLWLYSLYNMTILEGPFFRISYWYTSLSTVDWFVLGEVLLTIYWDTSFCIKSSLWSRAHTCTTASPSWVVVTVVNLPDSPSLSSSWSRGILLCNISKIFSLCWYQHRPVILFISILVILVINLAIHQVRNRFMMSVFSTESLIWTCNKLLNWDVTHDCKLWSSY